MFTTLFTILTALGALGLSQAAPIEDLIVDLPGLSTQPGFKQYSGYLQALGTRKLHYWFVESSSNASVDPVVLWMNGGPGCSSLDGLLTEHGPFRINIDSKTLHMNPYSWNQVANMIYLEAPAGVGFSYAEDKNYTTNDDETAANNLAALKSFFVKFPEFKVNDFYITGESYGGIYVPTLASGVIDDGSFNLKGFGVGNGLSDSKMNDNSLIFFAYFHGIIGENLWNALVKDCCPNNVSDHCDFSTASKHSEACCDKVIEAGNLAVAKGLDPFNLYSSCATDNNLHYNSRIGKFVSRNIMKPFAFLPINMKEKAFLKSLPEDAVAVGLPCINDTAITKYLNSPDVRKALHIPDEVQAWTLCSAIDYYEQYDTVAPIYQKVLAKKLRILVYNGDVDMICNFLGGKWFVDSLHPQGPQTGRFWYYQDPVAKRQVAGFVKTFDQITFVTVKGAGHMVPTDKPIPALKMFTNFIQNRPF